MYHYEAGGVAGVSAMGPGVPPGFSAINLSVKIAAAQAQRPRSPTIRDPRDPRPAIDLSTSSGSPQVRNNKVISLYIHSLLFFNAIWFKIPTSSTPFHFKFNLENSRLSLKNTVL